MVPAGRLGLNLLVALSLFAGAWVATACRAPAVTLADPPAVDLDGVDPAIAAVINAAQSAVREKPRAAEAWGHLGMVLYVHDFLAQALDAFTQAERLDARNPRWPYFQGLILKLETPDDAIPKLRRAVQLCGNEPDTPRLQLGELLQRQGRMEEAQVEFQQLIRVTASHARARLALAHRAVDTGELDLGRSHVETARENPRTRKAAALLLSRIAQQKGNQAESERYRHRADSLPPDVRWPDPFVEAAERLRTGWKAATDRARSLMDAGRVMEAVVLLSQTARDYPDSYWTWFVLGIADIENRDFAGAEVSLRNSVRLSPEFAESQFTLGVALSLQHRCADAMPFFQKAIDLKPGYATAHYNLGQCFVEVGKRNEAVKAFRQAVIALPTSSQFRLTLAEQLKLQGRLDEALAATRDALTLEPSNRDATRLLNTLLAKQRAGS